MGWLFYEFNYRGAPPLGLKLIEHPTHRLTHMVQHIILWEEQDNILFPQENYQDSILFAQDDILFPQDNILFLQEKYLVPSRY